MAVWKLTRLGAVSSATGKPFDPDVEIVTALFGDEEEQGEDRVRGAGFIRKDFLVAEATEEMLATAFCTWRTRTPPAKAEPERRFDLGMAREFLERAVSVSPAKAEAWYNMALTCRRSMDRICEGDALERFLATAGPEFAGHEASVRARLNALGDTRAGN